MRYQDQLVKLTQKALDDVCRAALAVPEDKRVWSPGGEARTVLSQMQEIAMAPDWFSRILREGKAPEMDGHAARIMAEMREGLGTVERCVEQAQEATSDLCARIAAFPDDRLDDELTLPFGGGSVVTMADVLDLHRWNMVYHLGQINQIQLMLGDKEMH